MSYFGEARKMDLYDIATKAFGSVIGVLISMVMVAPRNTANGVYRILLAPIAGIIFAEPTQAVVWFLAGDTAWAKMAAACAAGFTCWFILEFVARLISRQDTLQRLLEEILRIRNKGKD